MSAPTENELRREASRVLRKLCGGARLAPDEDGRYAVVSRSGSTRNARVKIAAALVDAMRVRGWLVEQDGLFAVSAAGRNWLGSGGDPFAAQHQILQTRRIADDQGNAHYVVVNAAESPLTAMHQRRLISDVQCEAGEQLRRDFTVAQLTPRLGVDLTAPISGGRRAAGPESLLPDIVIAAKQRFARALRAVGPGLSDILFDVCCMLRGLEENERRRGWPRASARVVLIIALDRLAEHYGMTRRATGRIRSWAMEDER